MIITRDNSQKYILQEVKDNLSNEDDPGLKTKQLLSHVESNFKS